MSQMQQIGLDSSRDIPLDTVIWSPSIIFTKRHWLYYILTLLLHILPAICIDGVLKLCGAKPMLFDLQRRVYVTNSALSHFLLNEWTFINFKYINLMDTLTVENKHFGINYVDIDELEFSKNTITGVKVYLLKEDMNNLETARKHLKRMDLLHNIVKTIFIITILWILYNKNILSNIANGLAYLFYINV